ncbi:putative mitochondrial DNA polymerase I protein A [Trypanosoma rangeli]|uniref:Putative mitochondrial DNA polymerase I protein A n=1 Tax=Trypanosoma rangeli TaxID=5698 RepID=A0A3R7NDP8_TRYRA|nr:putative mitochondrial DNA polymerase I protein A [Trypanosoma rangeli]RNF04918.1 putative mitochondrial DNA polymerase I protein A [Trypanosoma rangeli]|eukprot:RNF04918.1 putative mitochondrial DNA polymerase I protein A [Trypanosoma rangeli]
MSFAIRLNTRRSGETSARFWAESLAESQRVQTVLAPESSRGVPRPCVSGRGDAAHDDQQQQRCEERGEEEKRAVAASAAWVEEERGRGDGRMQPAPESGGEESAGHEGENDGGNVLEHHQKQLTVLAGTIAAHEPPERATGPTLLTTARQGGGLCRFKDVLAVGKPLLQGLLGPVGIDVELSGTTTMLRDPSGFAAALESMEQASCDYLRNLHASIQLFFIVRGESFYTLDASICSPLVFLAKLLSAPTVTKIVLQARPLYRLLFLFLGTDRVEVRNLVDVSVWGAVMERVCGPRPYTKACVDSQSLWQLLPGAAQEGIEVQLERAKQDRWCEDTRMAEEAAETMAAAATTTTTTTTVSSVLAPAQSEMSLVQLLVRFKSLLTLYAYYEAYMRSVESSGATGSVSPSLAVVCSLETRVSFLCEVMSYHGMFVEKDVLDCMVADLDQQAKAFVEKGNAALQALSPDDSIGEIDMETVTAWELLNVLQHHYGGGLALAVEGNEIEQLQRLAAHVEDTKSGTDANAARLWLALRERREFKRSIIEGFSKGVSMHARLIAAPEDIAATERSGHRNSHHATAPHRLCFSVHPTWSVHHATTARLFCSRPCLQNIAKNPPLSRTTALTSSAVTMFSNPEWTLRHLYGPPPGCTLLSFDFDQVELRVLAHLSGDPLLVQQLRGGSDVLAEMALHVMQLPRREDVTPYLRQGTKVVVYGLLYGMGPETLDVHLRQLHKETAETSGQKPLSARQVMHSFHQCYPAVQSFLRRTRLCAFHEKLCTTLNGVRNLSGELDGNRRKQAAVAAAIQGGAAVILHHAMVEVHERRHEFVPCFPAAALALVLSVHDELVYAVPDSAVGIVAPMIKHILERQSAALSLSVPLPVTMRAGKSFGALRPLAV